ncbi:MAG TPA: DUF6178 family protein [Vicinamibacterales bacterium]|jgi:hypothetical protein|nr:DUF6178 family protein [Vicinamibacterales bacterium]
MSRRPVHRARRRRADALRARNPRTGVLSPRRDAPARRDGPDSRPLLDRILDTPHLAHVVPHLQPEVLHRIIQTCGLEDCGEIVALATPGQLASVFDLDLWRADQPGLDEQLDADRFGLWLEVLVESDAAVAAQTLAAMDVDLVISALAQHIRVFDPAAVSPPAEVDGELRGELDGEGATARSEDDGPGCEVGGYRVVARRTSSWDAIVAALVSLDAEHRDCFHRVMRGCRSLSNSRPEVDGLDDLLTVKAQAMFDLAFDREQRRDSQGYVTPAQARAFLQMSRQFRLTQETTPPGNPVVRAYFRAIEWTDATDADSRLSRLLAAPGAPAAREDSPETLAAVAASVDALNMLMGAGDLPQQPRALLGGAQGEAPRLARIQAHMQFARDCDQAAYSMRSQELAYLANAIVAGCSVQARPFTRQEASEAAVAACNLGLENWPAGPALPDSFLVDQDLVTVFQVGWTVLHEDVCMYSAGRLIRVLASLQCGDREIQAGLRALRVAMAKHCKIGEPWRARDALDVMVILDMPAWATLLALIDECPVIHAGLGASRGSVTRAVDPSAFEFISENSQIASVHEFMRLLPDTLRRA